MASTEGGVEIEKLLKKNPDKIISVKIDPAAQIQGCLRTQTWFCSLF